MDHSRIQFLKVAAPFLALNVGGIIAGILMIDKGGWFIPAGVLALAISFAFSFFLYVMDQINRSE